jgi:Phosphotransferase enzyme family
LPPLIHQGNLCASNPTAPLRDRGLALLVCYFEKRRNRAEAGSIPDVLGMFVSEVRFYREIAPVVGIRVPACLDAQSNETGTYLRLEDLSSWTPGGDAVAMASELRRLHERWENHAVQRWPWLRHAGRGANLIGELFDRTWLHLIARRDLPGAVHLLGDRLVGHVAAAERAEGTAGPLTLCHGDASLENVFTSSSGEIAFVDWEDVRSAAGVVDLAWLLVSSVSPDRWDEVINAYGPASRLVEVLPSATVQGLLSLADHAEGSPAARQWIARLEAAAARI